MPSIRLHLTKYKKDKTERELQFANKTADTRTKIVDTQTKKRTRELKFAFRPADTFSVINTV